MGENTPERLKAFREEARERSRQGRLWPLINLIVLVLGFAGVLAAVVWLPAHGGAARQTGERGGLSDAALRDYATLLEHKGLKDAALHAYESYLERAFLEPGARANVCYSIGKLAISMERYEKALEYLYQAEMLNPENPVSDEISSKITLCLERLGRSNDLRRELRKRTALQRTADDLEEGEVVLAEFAGQIITDRDLDREIEKLPPAARDSFAAPDKRIELLRNMVAERLLLDKALRLELDQTPEVQDELARLRDSLVVQTLIDQEIDSKISISPEDIKRFYDAGLERFTEPAVRTGLEGSGESADAARLNLEEAQKNPDGATKVRVSGGRILQGLGKSELDEAVLDVIQKTAPGSVSAPVELDGVWYVFAVSETPARVHPFEEVKAQAERQLRAEKQREQFRALVADTLKARNVQLYPERLKKEPSEE
ncbi:MAG TPA: peptidyl-prolyl cis-trans isomerase [Candidatus Hydrogenedentes bacterium]|nr:peptidyl-prolyl cis-trans isomerase [Candidatus Hydrogenedentota bacterium]HPJ99439.1 peptidyl-prolyl cis-trans isomerase [Candidatus Hydrogenedentota bacterium]